MRWGITFLLAVLLFGIQIVAGAARQPAPRHPETGPLDCSGCHDCPKPTPSDPCLRICPRHEEAARLSPAIGPDVVILDDLEDLYVPVRFNHKAHARMAGMNSGCETCHHYTPPDAEHPACKDCHPREILHEDIAQPGLKGAYHRQCMSCHTEWDKDTACDVCHEKKAGGRLHGEATGICETRHYEAVEVKDLMLFPTSYEEGDQVPFHHLAHSRKYERDCTECHQEQSCSRCHVHGTELHPMGNPRETNLHDTCFACHDGDNCSDCHGRDPDDLFDHADTGWRLRSYHAGLNCRSCHGDRGAFMKLTPVCTNCHPGGWDAATFDHAVTGVRLGEVHGELECEDCHTEGIGGKASCAGCHDDGRTYDKSGGFGES